MAILTYAHASGATDTFTFDTESDARAAADLLNHYLPNDGGDKWTLTESTNSGTAICGKITRGVVGAHHICIEKPEDRFPHTHNTIHDHQTISVDKRLVSLTPNGQWQLRTLTNPRSV